MALVSQAAAKLYSRLAACGASIRPAPWTSVSVACASAGPACKSHKNPLALVPLACRKLPATKAGRGHTRSAYRLGECFLHFLVAVDAARGNLWSRQMQAIACLRHKTALELSLPPVVCCKIFLFRLCKISGPSKAKAGGLHSHYFYRHGKVASYFSYFSRPAGCFWLREERLK